MKGLLKKIHKKLPVLTIDILACPLAWMVAFWLRGNFEAINHDLMSRAILTLPMIFFAHFAFYYHLRVYRGVWRFVSLRDFITLIKLACYGGTASLITLFLIQKINMVPRSIFPIYTLLLIATMATARILVRLFREQQTMRSLTVENKKRVLIIGAGSAGERLLRDSLRQTGSPYQLIGLLDDDDKKQGLQIHGIKIIGTVSDMPILIEKHQVDMLFIAMPSVTSARLREIYHLCEKTRCQLRVLPSLNDLASGFVGVNALRNISIEDLLGRSEIKLDWASIASWIKDKRVLFNW